VATGALLLLPVNVIAQGIIEHGLELAPLALCDVAQCRQDIGRGLRGKLFTHGSGYGILIMTDLDVS
jgi:hypothetical protein